MVQLVCPTCTASTTVGPGGGDSVCSSCGSALVRLGSAPPPVYADRDRRLIQDVREAFEASMLGPDEESRRWASPSSQPESVSPGESPALRALAVETRLGDFEIIDELGRGGMGVVYRARQASLNREVALKVLPPTLRLRHSTVRRFGTESEAAARLNHPNVVPVYAHGEDRNHLYYAMQLIEGVSLNVAIHKRPELISSALRREDSDATAKPGGERTCTGDLASHQEVEGDACPACEPTTTSRSQKEFRYLAGLMAGVAEGLEHAHDHGVIHRDIKPHNLLLSPDGLLLITDFGLAHLTNEPHVTMSGEVMGTPAYLSPEQIRGGVGGVDHRTDIYSLGATLYEVVTRRRPFEGETRDQILAAICTTDPPRPRSLDRSIPRDLETICLRAMEKEPARRFPAAADMAGDLRRFAQGRPILSRRVGPVEITLKWMRRHRAATVAMAATIAVIVLAAGLVRTVGLSRRAQAANLLRPAYEQLAFLDYRKPGPVTGAIEEAESLGADPLELNLAYALAKLGASDETAAIEHLHTVLDGAPDCLRALYMLSWADWRAGNRGASLETFRRADSLGGPSTSDAWFFRGLAAHFDRPVVAMESYREANAQRASQDEFFPQAVLHLARAYNQQVYVSRTLDTFAEARANLEQLIEHGHYGAYPYYLLSIAHRLAGETLEADAADSDADLVTHHFEEALEWARAGQVSDPADDRPITAEAECLESMGRYEEAVAARTRAIELAKSTRKKWEGHHYRWRLYYWMGQFDAALADLEACTVFGPESRFYAQVYPALVLAEKGELADAAALAREIHDEGQGGAQAALWSATCLRLLGRWEEADELLTSQAELVDYSRGLAPPQSQEWAETLYSFCQGETGFDVLTSLVADVPTPRKLRGEAHFHAAAIALAGGEREEAFEHFTRAFRSYDGELGYTFHAKSIWQKMRGDAAWPPWIARASQEDRTGAPGEYEGD